MSGLKEIRNVFVIVIPEVELIDISCRLKPDFNAVRLSEKRYFLLILKSVKKWNADQNFKSNRKPIFFYAH